MMKPYIKASSLRPGGLVIDLWSYLSIYGISYRLLLQSGLLNVCTKHPLVIQRVYMGTFSFILISELIEHKPNNVKS